MTTQNRTQAGTSRHRGLLYAAAATTLSLLSAGCGVGTGPGSVSGAAPVSTAAMLGGGVHGGQQPVAGSHILLYAAGVTGYGGILTNLLTVSVTSDNNGYFSFPPNSYTCTAGQQIYLVAQGGNPGIMANNPNLDLMAALGDCAGLSSSTFVQVNEVTTVAGVAALAPFMSAYNAVGTSSANNAGLVHAFTSAAKLANFSTGLAPGPMLAPGAVAPVSEINSLANSIASCINSPGGSAGDNSACGNLFADTRNSSGVAPTEVIGALLNLAQNPSQNATAIFGMANAISPFQPALPSAPSDWSMSINYPVGSFSTPATTTVDASGNIWVANRGNSTVTALAQTGTPLAGFPLSGNGLSTPSALAIDASGNAWVTNQAGNSLSVFTGTGGIYAGSPFTGGGLSAPAGIAFDSANDVWVTNGSNNSISEFYTSGTFLQQITGIASPSAVAIDPK